jgi:NDP-sugar pyrophosphorylase family protein
MDKVNAFVLAAGLGERLQSITQHIPKPLVPVLGKPVIQHVFDKIERLSYHQIGINLHYKKNHMLQWLDYCSLKEKIKLFQEDTILGTGGALKNAESFLSERAFIVHNSDILSDIKLEDLVDHHVISGNIATLAIHDYPKFNTLIIDEKGFLKGLSNEKHKGTKKWAFTGIAVYNPDFLDYLPDGMSGVVDAWQRAVNSGRKIGTYNVTGCKWSDIGTPSAYARAVFDELKSDGEIVYIHPSSKACDKIEMKEHVVIERECGINKSIMLRNCIMLPGTSISSCKDIIENSIIGPGFTLKLNINEIPAICGVNGKQLIGTGGSERKYYRIRAADKSEVLMQCCEDDPDFNRQLEYTKFFRKCSVPVPELLRYSEGKKQAVFEDAGDISLYSYLKCTRSSRTIEKIYRKILDALLLIHLDATDRVHECPLLENRLFDHDYFKWETDYFLEEYIKGVNNITLGNEEGIQRDLENLASKADSFVKAVIHRDFQSQNIMVMPGREIRIIDYQGARIGPPAYDIASLLWDPYVALERGLRESLLDYYAGKLNSARPDISDFYTSLLTCRLQRHMQALGAYGYLSHKMGKHYFMKYIPQGLRLLKDDISSAEELYPDLFRLIMNL